MSEKRTRTKRGATVQINNLLAQYSKNTGIKPSAISEAILVAVLTSEFDTVANIVNMGLLFSAAVNTGSRATLFDGVEPPQGSPIPYAYKAMKLVSE